MMRILRSVYCFFPIQLLLLHVKKFQVLLVFWIILFSTLNGGFMRTYGAAAQQLGNSGHAHEDEHRERCTHDAGFYAEP